MMFPFLKEAVKNLFSRPSTVMYPQVNVDAKPGYRGRIAYDPDKCVSCGMCEKVCSPSAITRTVEPADGGERVTLTFDLTSCTFCGMCQDFCEEKAIRLTDDYHMVALDGGDLMVSGTRFRKTAAGVVTVGPDCVFCGLCAKKCPAGAISVDRQTRTWSIEPEKCVHCGACVSGCPKKTLYISGQM